MPRLLALEWNGSEARMAVAALRGDRPVIEQAFWLALRHRDPESQEAVVSVGEQIAGALHERGIGRIETLVAIGRSNIELRQLSVPPAPDEELPDLVRMQATREFNALDEDWPLDFIPSEQEPGQPRSVLAAALDPEQLAQIQQTCQTAGLKAHRLILRPCAAASLLNRAQPDRCSQLRLLVDLLLDEADLTVTLQRKVTFMRTARLPGDPLSEPDAAQALLGEIRRTIAAAQNQLGGRRVESIVLCGIGQPQAALAQTIQEALSLPTELFNPFAGLQLGPELQRALPDRPGRFAPLLGILLDESEQAPHAIDFLHPPRRPAPPSRRKQYALGGLSAAVLLVGYFTYSWWEQNRLEAAVQALTLQVQSLDPQVKQAENTTKAVTEIEKWMATDVTWLDQLYELCKEFPTAENARLSQLALSSLGSQGGKMELEGLARNPTIIDAMEKSLRDALHKVEGKGRSQEPAQKAYPWRFESSVLVEPEKR